MKSVLFVSAVFVVVMAAETAQAGEGLFGLYQHNVLPLINGRDSGGENGVDIQFGYRTDRIDGWTWLGRPQVHAIVSANSNGDSNFVAAGLSWPIKLTHRLYLRPGIGLAYTDGHAHLPAVNEPGISPAEVARREQLRENNIEFGDDWLFEPEFAVGWRFNSRVALEASYVHLSNGEILHHGKNQGLDDVGLRMAYRF